MDIAANLGKAASAAMGRAPSSSYAQVSQNDEVLATSAGIGEEVMMGHGRNDLEARFLNAQQSPIDELPRSSAYVTQYPQLQGLTWRDSYFDTKPGILAVFDRDGATAGKWVMWKYLRTSICMWVFSVLYWALGVVEWHSNLEESLLDDICGTYLLIFGAIFAALGWRSQQAMLSQHIALTMEGLRVDSGGMLSVTVGYDQIEKIHVFPFKYCGQTAPIMVVRVFRQPSPLEAMGCNKYRQMDLMGMLRANDFKTILMTMKNSQGTSNSTNYGQDQSSEEDAGRVELQDMS